MVKLVKYTLAIVLAGSLGCQTTSTISSTKPDADGTPQLASDATDNAVVREVNVTGEPGSYTFAVTVESPDTGCDRYADWWEVISDDGELLYRRVLLHSHVDEQPFSRSGGPVPIQPEQTVLVRAHMSDRGYGPQALQGSVENGFEAVLDAPVAAGVATQPPLPQGCDF
ncbi:MAG: hypothetical protein WBG38_13460 [Nodosilinea sp.]